MTILNGWESFYVIVGSSAGALIGLQFVVISLISEGPTGQGEAKASKAFTSPTVIHFSVVLLISALVSAPWEHLSPFIISCSLVGLSGLIYTTYVVAGRIRVQSVYQPLFEDHLFHILLPAAAYAILLCSAGMALYYPRQGMFGLAGAALVLLFSGIHNAWDTVEYNVFVWRRKAKRDTQPPPSPPARPDS
jgi:hypothetical protein